MCSIHYSQKSLYDVISKCVIKSLPILLVWETGTGKTTIVKKVADDHGKTLLRLNMNGQIGREEFVGKYVLEAGATKRQDWPLLTAMRKGYWILIDEINAALPEVLFVLQALLENNDWRLGEVLLSEKDGNIVKPHKDFRVFATMNPTDKYVGTKDLNIATMSRFVVYTVDSLLENEERTLLHERFPEIEEAELFRLTSLATKLRELYEKDSISYFCSTRDLVSICTLLHCGVWLDMAIRGCIIDKVQDQNDKQVIRKTIEDSLGVALDILYTQLWEVKQIEVLKEKFVELEKEKIKLLQKISEQKNIIDHNKETMTKVKKMRESMIEINKIYQQASI